MPNRSLLLACGVLLGAIAMPAQSADPAPKEKPAPQQAAPQIEPEPAPAASPYFLGILKEGEKLPTPAAAHAAKKAAADKADLDAALHESMDIAIRLGTFALKLLIAIAIAALTGLSIAVVVSFTKRRHKQLMAGKTSWRGGRD